MMWTQYSIGEARWQAAGWTLQIANDAQGIRLRVSNAESCDSEGVISLDGDRMPQANEMFVRGDELHLYLPQKVAETQSSEGSGRASGDCVAGLEVVFTPIVSEGGLLVVESTVSLQTQWLDVHPRLLIELPNQGKLNSVSNQSAIVFSSLPEVGVPTGASTADALSAMVLVDERDRLSLAPFGKSEGGIRFFDEFMEKGVIRKIQPWWVWTLAPLNERRIAALCDELAQRPLPLAG